jgi:hypothetical protein
MVTEYQIRKINNTDDRWVKRVLIKKVIAEYTQQVKQLEQGMIEDGEAFKRLLRIEQVRAFERRITEFCKTEDAVEAITAEIE